MKVGVIGGGRWGQNIIRTLNELGHLHAVADDWAETRTKLEGQYPDVQFFDNGDDLITSGVEAVAIATPAPVHFELGKKVLEAGIPCFIEKPMTLNSRDAEELCDLADSKGVALMVGHLLIYQPAVAFLKKALDEGMIGKIATLNHERLNLGRARDVESVLWSLGVHDIAVSLYLAGSKPVECGVTGAAALQPLIEDDTRLWMKFDDGSVGHIHNSWLWPEKRRMLTIVGTAGMLVYNELEQTVTLHKKTISVPDLADHDNGSEVVFEGAGQPLTLEMEHFVECAQTGATPRTCGRSGLEVVRVMEQVSPVAVEA